MAKKAFVYDGTQWVDIAQSTADLSNYANMTTTPISGFRNAIINGDFRINQRGFTSTTSNGAFTFDRWVTTVAGTQTYSTQAFNPGESPSSGGINYLRIATNAGASNYATIQQRIEDVRTFAGDTVTISFWAKAASGTPKIDFGPYQIFGTGGSSRVDVTNKTITLSTSWQRFTHTVTIPSISGKTIGTGSYLALELTVNNAFNSAVGQQTNTFDIWGVQVEKGTIATPFEQRPIGTELALCQRYFYSIPGGELTIFNPYFGVNLGGGGQFIPTRHPVNMRVAPTMPSTTAFTYLQNAAGTALGFNVGLGSNVFGFTGVYSSSSNSGSVLPSTYAIGQNQATISLSSEL